MKYKITNYNSTKATIYISGSSNPRILAPGAELFLGELSDEKAAAYKRAYNCLNCTVSVVPETPVNKCIEDRLPKPKNTCSTPTKSQPVDDLISVEDKINRQVLADIQEGQSEQSVVSEPVQEEVVEQKQENVVSEELEIKEEAHEEEVEQHEEKHVYTEEELSEMTKSELLEIARGMELEVDGRSSIKTLTNLILSNQ